MKKLLSVILTLALLLSVLPAGVVGAQEFCEHLNKSSKYDSENHWTECNDCHEKFNVNYHDLIYTNDGDTHSVSCENCEYKESGLRHGIDIIDNYNCDKCGAIHNTFVEGNFKYAVLNNEAIILDVVGVFGDLEIPSTLGGYPLTSIGGDAFYNCDNIISVIIPDNVTSIGDSAFDDCDNLTSVTIGNSVTSIGASAFYDCVNLTDVWYSGSETDRKKIEIGYGNYDLTYATWHYNTCENHSFTTNECGAKCSNCDFVKEHKMVTKYNDNNHWTACENPNCTERTAYIPHEIKLQAIDYINHGNACTCGYVTNLEYHDFEWDEGKGGYFCVCDLRSVRLKFNDYVYYISKNHAIVSVAENSLGKENFVIPDSINGFLVLIKDNRISGIDIKSIEVSENNQYYSTIDGVLFNKDKSELIQYPDTKDSKLYDIPNSVTSIGNYAFYSCDNLTNITIGNGIKNIGDSAFKSCYKLTDVWYKGTETEREKIEIGDDNDRLESATWHYNSTGPCTQHTWQNATCTEPMTCTVCGNTEGIEKGHDYTQKVVTPATCKNTGIMNYKCTVCDDSFNRTISKTTKHNYKPYTTKATYAKAGSVVTKCSICGKVKSTKSISRLKPKTTKISKLTAKKKSLVVKIKRNKSVSGYQIQYSLKKNFKSAKTVTLKKNSLTSKTIKNLKSKKTYYVRVRTYKTYKGKKYYSAWSKVSKKKTK